MKQEQGQEEVGVRLHAFLSKGANCMCATPPIQGRLEMVGGEVAQNSSDGCLGELGTARGSRTRLCSDPAPWGSLWDLSLTPEPPGNGKTWAVSGYASRPCTGFLGDD